MHVQNVPFTLMIVDAEGGADRWERPALPPLNEKKDTISKIRLALPLSFLNSVVVFQQIDVEETVDSSSGRSHLRMFGVTEVTCLIISSFTLLTIHYRQATVSLQTLPTSFPISMLLHQEVLQRVISLHSLSISM